jgi:hypothetical protein
MLLEEISKNIFLEDSTMYRMFFCIVTGLCLAGSVYAVGLGSEAAYSLDTSMVLYGPYDPTAFTSLDGTWVHYWSDRWDGSGIGEGSPGGVSSIDGYLRLQDPGDPRDFGVADAVSNRKIYFAHDIAPDGASDTVLDDGATLFFRMRLATSGLLDQLTPNSGSERIDVPATGDGYVIHDGGKGMVGIKQAARGIISFSLTTAEENNGTGGLIMNSLNGTSLSSNVDSGEGTANIIPLDPTVWHDFWVTIQADTSGVGTHQVDVYVDGGPAQTFLVTAGTGNDYDGVGFIGLGAGSTNASTAFDIAAYQFTPGIVVTGVSSPANGATDVGRDAVLSWTSAESGGTSNVYLGTDFDEVQNAGAGSPLLVGPGIEANTFDPENLEYDQIYYWRVDKIGAEVIISNIWSFTVEPFAHTMTPESIIATASSSLNADSGPEKTVDRSGLNASDQHDTLDTNMWTSATGQQAPVWIQYEFDTTKKLYAMWIWNSNNDLEWLEGRGIKTAVIEYSTDGATWTALANVPEFAQAPGIDDYDDYTTVDFGSVAAKFVKITCSSSWGGGDQYGLSEVRFLYIPVNARHPQPNDGATDVAIDVILGWGAGREAAEHNVYISDDEQSVIDGTVAAVTVNETSYGPLSLDLGKKYYWRVDEVNNVNTVPIWEGGTWSFTTREYLVVDDFESYNDIEQGDNSNLVYATWSDGGYGSTNDPTNGSTIGYLTTPSMETTIFHSGSQSVPVLYDNTSANKSEVTVNPADLPVGRDWTVGSPEMLVVWFYGDPNNSAADRIYVKVNGVQRSYDGDLTQAQWQEFTIDLASLDISLENVIDLTIGFESGGSGMVFIDDILLYTTPPEVAALIDPGST